MAKCPGSQKHRRGRPLATVRAAIAEQLLVQHIDSSFRLPVPDRLALVVVVSIWPTDKNLAELIALSAALLVASQFWYLDKGGALVMLYLPLAIAMMFRPTLSIPQAFPRRYQPPRDPAFPFIHVSLRHARNILSHYPIFRQ